MGLKTKVRTLTMRCEHCDSVRFFTYNQLKRKYECQSGHWLAFDQNNIPTQKRG